MDRVAVKLGLILAVLFTATACQVLTNEQSKSYLQESYKWEELIRHSGNTITQTGYTVTAEVTRDEIEGEPNYTISNIRITRVGERESALDMFGYDVGKKSVCAGTCSFLSGISPGQQESELALLFEQQEGAIFRFFTEWKKINRDILYFDGSSKEVFRKYLNYIRTSTKSIDNLDDFTAFFKQMLKEEKLIAFAKNSFMDVSDPEEKKAKRLAKASNSTEILVYDDLPDNWEEMKKPTSDWLSSEQDTADHIVLLDLIEEKENELAKSHIKTDSWNKAKKLPLIAGVNVCSFSDNRFGTIVSLSNGDIKVEVKGQAKVVKDGIVSDATEGYLFGPIEELLFTAEAREKNYPVTDIAVCSVSA